MTMLQPTLTFDLETIPDVAGLRRLFSEQYPLDLSDEEVIKLHGAHLTETRGSDFFPLHLQKIVAISCCFRHGREFKIRSIGSVDSSESSLIQGFFKTIDRYQPRLVSWNGNGFDLPVLHHRALIHGVSSSQYWDLGEFNRDAKFNNYLSRYHIRHIDVMDVLSKYGGGRGNAPLDQMAKLCGFPGKLDMDGSQVWQSWYAGERQSIRDYCETDVLNTWLMYCRFLLIKGDLLPEDYQSELQLAYQTIIDLPGEHWQAFCQAWGFEPTVAVEQPTI